MNYTNYLRYFFNFLIRIRYIFKIFTGFYIFQQTFFEDKVINMNFEQLFTKSLIPFSKSLSSQ